MLILVQFELWDVKQTRLCPGGVDEFDAGRATDS